MENHNLYANIPTLKDYSISNLKDCPIEVKFPLPITLYYQDMDCMMIIQNLIFMLDKVVGNNRHYLLLMML